MATFTPRTRNDIFQSLLDAKTNYSDLDGLTNLDITDEQSLFNKLISDVPVSIWILWLHLYSFIIWILENTLQQGIIEFEGLRNFNYGNGKWVEYLIKNFQDGDEVIFNEENQTVGYELEDESKKIIGSVITETIPGAGLIKVRGVNQDVLDPESLNRLTTYWNRTGVLGINYIIQNSNPDLIKIIGTVKYKGEKLQGEIQTEVESIINDYIKNISENNKFVTNELLNKILNVDGVVDFEINQLQAKPSNGNYTNVTFRYNTNAGYLSIDPDSPLSNSIVYEIEKIY